MKILQTSYPITVNTLFILSIYFLSQLYIIPKVISIDIGFDFRLIWLAGKIWANGASPYSDIFKSAYDAEFGFRTISHFWVYPPYWWFISRPISELEFETALLVWNGINFALIHVGSFLFARCVSATRSELGFSSAYMMIAGIVCLYQATPFALALGQTSFLVFCGVACLAFGLRYQHRTVVFIGVLLVMLKPNIGLIFVVAILPLRFVWLPILASAVIYSGLSVLVILLIGFDGTVPQFLANLSEYNAPDIRVAQPHSLTGIINLADYVNMQLSGALLLVFCAVISPILGIIFGNSPYLIPCIGIIALFIIPMHTYDLMIFAPLLIMIYRSNIFSVALILLALFITIRAENLAVLSGFIHPDSIDGFQGSLLASLGLGIGVLVLLGTLAPEKGAQADVQKFPADRRQ